MTLTLFHRGWGVYILPPWTWARFYGCLMNWMGRKCHSTIFEIIQLLPSPFFYRMLTLGTQPPCCDKAQTSLCGETTWRDSCGEKLRPPADSGHQLRDTWVNAPSDDSHPRALCSRAEAQTYVMGQRKVIPTVPCPNSWPRESMSRINGYFMPQSLRAMCYTAEVTGTKTF